MPRAFDTGTLVALYDPNRSDINIKDIRPHHDLAEMLLEGIEWMFDVIVSELGKVLGFDFTQFLLDVKKIVTNVERLFGDLNPLGGTFNPIDAIETLISVIRDTLVTLPIDLINGLPAFIANVTTNIETLFQGLVGFVEGIPILGQIVEAILGIPGDLVNLATWAVDVLTGKSPLFSGNLFGQIEAGIIGLIPGAHVAEVSPNLLTDGDFPDAATLAGDSVWTWDGTQGHTYHGCASVVCDGTVKDLSSDLIHVAKGHVLAGSAWVMWSGLTFTAGTHPIRLKLSLYQNTGTSSRPAYSLVGNPDLAYDSSGLAGSGWRQLTGTYTVPDGVDAVRLVPHVDASATLGTVKWDDLSLVKTQKMSLGMLDGLTDIIGGIWSFLQDLVDGITSAIRLIPIVGAPLADALTALEDLVGLTHGTAVTADGAVNAHNDLLGNLLNYPEHVIGELTDDLIPGIGQTLTNIWAGLTGHTADMQVSHASAQGVLEHSAAAMTAAQAEITLLKASLTGGTSAQDTFSRTESTPGTNWASMPVGSTVFYPHTGQGQPQTDGNNLFWNDYGNTSNTKLLRWTGPGQHSLGRFQAVSIVLSSQGEDPFLGKTSGDQILARVSDDGLNYIRLQANAYVGNSGDPSLQLFYCVGGVETRLWWKDVGPVPGSGAVLTLLAGLKGYNDHTYSIIINNNIIDKVTENFPISWCTSTPSTMGWGLGMTAGNNFGGFLGFGERQACPGKINTWTAQDQ
jgi:hypothetical protein